MESGGNAVDDCLQQNAKRKSSEEYTNLMAFLNSNGCAVGKGSPYHTFVDQRNSQNYYISAMHIPTFFDLLNKCNASGVITGFSEDQHPVDMRGNVVKESGICIDLDIKQRSQARLWKPAAMIGLTNAFISLVLSNCDTSAIVEPEYTYYVLSRQTIDQIDQDSEGPIYRDGVHILIPSIQICKELKRWAMTEFKKQGTINNFMKNPAYIDPSGFVDVATSWNPILLYGCARVGKKPYKIDSMVQTDGTQSCGTSMPEAGNKVQILSLVHPSPEAVKHVLHPTEKWLGDRAAEVKDAPPTLTDEPDYGSSSLRIDDMDDPTYNVIAQFIQMMSKERSTETKTWRQIIIALANMDASSSGNYKALAHVFSAKCPEKYNTKKAREEIDALWKWTASRVGSGTLPDMRTIYKAAKEDNYEEYKNKQKTCPTHMMMVTTSKADGKLPDYDAARILYALFSRKFFYDSSNKKWYDYVTKHDIRGTHPGQMYKYREAETPNLLMRYVMEKLPIIIDTVVDFYKKQRSVTTDEDQLKYFKSIIAKLCSTRDRLKEMSKATNIIKACILLFTYQDFNKLLDKDRNILGIANGIVVLGAPCKLIEGRHEYYVRSYANVPWVINDDVEFAVQYLMEKWNATFMEEDLAEYNLMWFAYSLSGNTYSPKLLIWHGPGKNGKSTWMMLHALMLGCTYSMKLASSHYTTPAQRAEQHTSYLMGLKTARYVYTSETNPGDVFYMDKVKMLTSGEHLPLRELQEKQDKEATTCAHFHVATNNVLKLAGDLTYGSMRRLMWMYIRVQFMDHPDPDKSYERKGDPDFQEIHIKNPVYQQAWLQILLKKYETLASEYGGNIDNFKCKTMEKETEEYIQSQDSIAAYISACLRPSTMPNARIMLTHLTEEYITWYTRNVSKKATTETEPDHVKGRFMNSKIQSAFQKEDNVWYLNGYDMALQN